MRAVGGSVLDQKSKRSFSSTSETMPSPLTIFFHGFCAPSARKEKTKAVVLQ
jgi:hypothetical protein